MSLVKMARLTVLWIILIHVLQLVARTDAVTEDQFHELAVKFEAMEKRVIQLTETGKLGVCVCGGEGWVRVWVGGSVGGWMNRCMGVGEYINPY